MAEIRLDVTETPSQSTRPLALSLLKLARPHQWSKSIFVLAGPIYYMADPGREDPRHVMISAFIASAAFALASSACYVINDLRDVERDRQHPRKCKRPIAAGQVSMTQALVFASALLIAAAGTILLVAPPARGWLGLAVAVYVVNVMLYSFIFKRVVITDVMALSVGFVIRVLGGCAAAGIEPSSWLLNCTFFLAMFLSFGKRLGERRTMGDNASAARQVQETYTDELLRMAVVVTAVAALLTYSGYVQDRGESFTRGFNLLWLTVLPATYCMFRCIVLLERGTYDDPTELASKDRPFQLGVIVFGAFTGSLTLWPEIFLGGASGP